MKQKPNSYINQWVNSVVNLHLKKMLNKPSIDLVNSNVYTNMVKCCSFILKILSKIHILTLIKGVTLLQICTQKSIYKPSLDLVNDNVHTIFGLILMTIKGRNSVTNLGKTKCTISNVDLVNDKCIYIIWSHSVFLFSRYRAKTKFWHK